MSAELDLQKIIQLFEKAVTLPEDENEDSGNKFAFGTIAEVLERAEQAAAARDFFATTAHLQYLEGLIPTYTKLYGILAMKTPLEGSSAVDAFRSAQELARGEITGIVMRRIDEML